MLLDRRTFIFTDVCTNQNVIDSKMVYRIKRNADNQIVKYKACMVARGYKQQIGIDFGDCYASTARSAS